MHCPGSTPGWGAKLNYSRKINTMIEKLENWSFPDTKLVPDGNRHTKDVPDISARNIGVLINKINELIEGIRELTEKVDYLKSKDDMTLI
ncbi:hypothetical protein LCGC14_2340510 [marine sediment metagenome]|uniref:Uncharacterized protein n=1 Tax=marine sediment metagenome TaxID=412755 RepID=A0A0F9EPW6_9ZZZZ